MIRVFTFPVLALTLVGCGNDNDPTALARVDQIVIEPQDTTIQMPEQPGDPAGFRYRITLLDASGDPITDPRVIEWRSSHPLVAQVASVNGSVTPVGPGLTEISASTGGLTARTDLTVE